MQQHPQSIKQMKTKSLGENKTGLKLVCSGWLLTKTFKKNRFATLRKNRTGPYYIVKDDQIPKLRAEAYFNRYNSKYIFKYFS